MDLPHIESYGKYAGKNYGTNALRLTIGPLSIWYSYQTPIAFSLYGTRTVRENDWKQTTGQHLNAIDGGSVAAKRARVTSDEFVLAWDLHIAPLFREGV